MPSYLITGAAQGIGYAFVSHLSADPSNTVIGIVRDRAASEKKAAEDFKRSNIHFVQADMTDYNALKNSVNEVSKITKGSLDYLIANAGIVPTWDVYNAISDFAKKIIVISSGMADGELTRNFAIINSSFYAVSKAESNTAVAKISAQYSEEGILFMSICTGTVEVGHWNQATEEEKAKLGAMGQKFMQYAPDFEGPATPDESVHDMLGVINKASVEGGYGGCFISHLGTKKWLGGRT